MTYAINLSSKAVNRERIEKIYMLIFAKPRSQSYILLIKLLLDIVEESRYFCILLPLKYFIPTDIVSGNSDIIYIVISVIMILAFTVRAYYSLGKKYMNAAN